MKPEKRSGLLQQLFLRLPLRKTFLILTGITTLLLITVSVLGARQYLLYRHCEQMVASSRRLLFQFSVIQKHINESLIIRNTVNFKDVITEIENLEKSTREMGNDILIPEEFKIGFISQIDLVGLAVRLRAIQDTEGAPAPELLSAALGLVHSLDERISQFHQGLSTYSQALLLGLHKTLAGFLALVLAVVSSLLLLMNKTFSAPILTMGKHVLDTGKIDGRPTSERGNPDISLDEILNTVTSLSLEHQNLARLLSVIGQYERQVQQIAERNISPVALDWRDLCSVLQTNGDYCLVWVGSIDEQAGQLQPINASGYLATNEEGYLTILDHLLKYCKKEGGLCESINATLETKTAHVSRLFTSSLPDSLRDLLSITGDTFSSASFPFFTNQKLVAIISLYQAGHHCFQPTEIELLSYFFRHLAPQRTSAQHEAPFSPRHLPLPSLSRIYRYSALGSLSTGLAHELTNLSNGAINYTQALLDLTDDQGNNPESRILLDSLLTAEKKISRMAVELQQLARDNTDEARPNSIEEIMRTIDTLITGQTKAEGIELKINIALGLPAISKKGKDIQLVILSLIQCARIRILEKYPSGRHEQKQIQIAAALAPTHPDHILITIQDQGAAWSRVEPPGDSPDDLKKPWLELYQCKIFLQDFGGDLMIEPKSDQKNICSLLLPC